MPQGTVWYMPPRTHVDMFLLGGYQEVGLLAQTISAVLKGLAKCLMKRQDKGFI